MRTSYSALDTYKTCPLKYKYQEIDKIKTPKKIEAVFGTLVHSSLKYMFERNPLYPTLDEVIDNFTRSFNEKSAGIEWSRPEKKEAEEKMYYEEGVKILKNFYKKNQPWNFNALELESRFSLEITDEKTGEVHTLAGIMDRLDKDEESGIYEIIDYKTGKKMPSEESLTENLQLSVYYMALLKKWPSVDPQKIKTSLYFLKHNEKISTVPKNENIERMRATILKAIEEIEENKKTGDFPPQPGPLCDWCGFRKLCPMWSHEYKKELSPAPNEEELASAIAEFFEIKTTDDINKKRAAKLREDILSYMDKENVDRVFGQNGYITRNTQYRFSYDIEKVKPILENCGLWNEILEPDEKKIDKILGKVTPETQDEILAARAKKSFVVLKPTKKKGGNGEEEDEDE